MTTLRIGLAQVHQMADFETNAAIIMRFLDQAGEAGVQVICFPETQTVGYRADITPAHAPVPVAKLNDLHERVAQRCGELALACILGTEIPHSANPEKGKPYNSALVIRDWARLRRELARLRKEARLLERRLAEVRQNGILGKIVPVRQAGILGHKIIPVRRVNG